MSQTEMSGEDASLDAAVAAIVGKMQGDKGPAPDARPAARGDVNEYDGSTDLEELEAQQADAQANANAKSVDPKATGDEPAEESEAEKGAEASGEEQYLELPPEAEGGEVERIPLTEAIAAFKAQRQIQGDIANVINEAEAKYQKEQDGVLEAISKIHDVVLDRAEAALRIMPRPQMPSELLLDRNSQYYDPETYHLQKLNYDKQVDVIRTIVAERDKAAKDKEAVTTLAQQQQDAREHERLSRLKGWEDWKDPAKREARSTEMMTSLEKHYGIPRDLMDKYPFHHGIMQMAADALAHRQAPVKAAEVKKQVQEKAPKIVNGRAADAPRDKNGRFVNEARQRLRESGSEDAFAEVLLRSGALKNLR